MKLNNTYYFARHGSSYSNGHGFFSSWPEKRISYLLPAGEKQIKANGKLFQEIGLDLIFASDLARTKKTAEIIAQATNAQLFFDKRLREIDFGVFNGLPVETYEKFFKTQTEKFSKNPPKGENLAQVQKRIFSFWQEINKKYKNKKILIVSHGGPLALLESKIKNKTIRQTIWAHRNMLKTGEFKKLVV